MLVESGEIYFVDLGEKKGSIQSGKRFCIIIENTMACIYSPCVHIVPLTSKTKKQILHHTLLKRDYSFLTCDSIALCEQYQLINKTQLLYKVGELKVEDEKHIIKLCSQNLP